MTAYGILTDAVDPNTLLTHADISLDVAGDIVTELRRIQMEWMKGFENGDYNPNSQAFTGLNVLIGAQQGMSVMNCSTWGVRDDLNMEDRHTESPKGSQVDALIAYLHDKSLSYSDFLKGVAALFPDDVSLVNAVREVERDPSSLSSLEELISQLESSRPGGHLVQCRADDRLFLEAVNKDKNGGGVGSHQGTGNMVGVARPHGDGHGYTQLEVHKKLTAASILAVTKILVSRVGPGMVRQPIPSSRDRTREDP